MVVQAIEQGSCTECGRDENNWSVEEKTFRGRVLTCRCGARASVIVSEDGIETAGSISLEDASWNSE